MPYRHLGAVLTVFSLLFIQPLMAAATERTFGIVPQHGAVATAQQWLPLLTELSHQTGVRFRFVTAPSVTAFEHRLIRGDYDYAYMSSALYLDAKSLTDYRALAQRKQPLTGIIVVRKNRPIRLSDLQDQTIAFPSPRALGATVLTRTELRKNKIGHSVTYLGTHESVYRAVSRGQFIAGGGILHSFNLLPEGLRGQLRILHTTPTAPPDIIAAHKKIPRAESIKIRNALISLNHTTRGRAALAHLFFEQLGPLDKEGLTRLAELPRPTIRRTQTIVFHVIPRLDRKSTQTQMQPLATYLGQRLELQVQLAAYSTMGEFEHAIYREKRPALINANPVQAVRLADKGYRVIAQQLPVSSPEGMRGMILVAENSRFRSLADLQGKRIAFGGNRNAFFASIVPRYLLGKSGLENKYQDVSRPGPVSDVIRRLHEGEIEAAGTGTMALHSKVLQNRYGVHKMRVLAQSEPMPGLAWLLGPSVEPALVQEIKNLLLDYRAESPGHEAMRAAGISGLRPATLKEYRIVNKYLKNQQPAK